VLGQRQRRRPRLDPAKIDVNHVTGDENVSVVNRATGKRITGAKAPPIRYLKEWLLRNPEYDVDPKWGHIVKAKASIMVLFVHVHMHCLSFDLIFGILGNSVPGSLLL